MNTKHLTARTHAHIFLLSTSSMTFGSRAGRFRVCAKSFHLRSCLFWVFRSAILSSPTFFLTRVSAASVLVPLCRQTTPLFGQSDSRHRYRGIGGDGRIRNPCQETQCKGSVNVPKMVKKSISRSQMEKSNNLEEIRS